MKYSTQEKRMIEVALQPPLNLTQKLCRLAYSLERQRKE